MKHPLYFQRYYAKVYENPTACKILGFYPIWQTLGLFCKGMINKSLLKEIKDTDHVLIFGASFDNAIELVSKKAKKVKVVDFSQLQIENLEKKFFESEIKVMLECRDVATPTKDKYDVVICNNILHQVPNVTKSKIVNNALKATKTGGSTVFLDYHNPSKYFVFRWFIKVFNRIFQPFAEKLWDKSIVTFAKDKLQYSWRKKTFCMGCFQKVVARKKQKYNTSK